MGCLIPDKIFTVEGNKIGEKAGQISRNINGGHKRLLVVELLQSLYDTKFRKMISAEEGRIRRSFTVEHRSEALCSPQALPSCEAGFWQC